MEVNSRGPIGSYFSGTVEPNRYGDPAMRLSHGHWVLLDPSFLSFINYSMGDRVVARVYEEVPTRNGSVLFAEVTRRVGTKTRDLREAVTV